MNTMFQKSTSCFLLVVLLLQRLGHFTVHSAIVQHPADVQAPLGSDVTFECETDKVDHQVDWRMTANNTTPFSPVLIIYSDGCFNFRFAPRYTFVTTDAGTSTLKITSIIASDAGKFECVDDDGFGERAAARLRLVESIERTRNPMRLNFTTTIYMWTTDSRLQSVQEESTLNNVALPQSADVSGLSALVVIPIVIVALVIFASVEKRPAWFLERCACSENQDCERAGDEHQSSTAHSKPRLDSGSSTTPFL